jgi:hypothetical protein
MVAVADVTFWGRDYGVLVFRSHDLKQNLYWTEVKRETTDVYRAARRRLEELGYTFDAIVLDGRRGVREVFADIPVQICHFHQVAAVNRYLTSRPKLPAGQELRALAVALPRLTQQLLCQRLAAWYERWQEFLKERTYSEDGKHWQYTHRRIRAAHRSLTTNLPYLFTYQQYPKLAIPNTTNSLDGFFSHLKELLRLHRGLRRPRRWRLIQEILAK